jgi:hypothetical protein
MPRAIMIELHGVTKSVQEWSRFYNRSASTVLWRLRHGYSPFDALTTKTFNTTYLFAKDYTGRYLLALR